MIRRVDLPRALAVALLAAAAAARPRECCGLIEGLRNGDIARILALHPARNLARETARFDIDPRDQFAAAKAARANGRAIIGCYHSHLGGKARPSASDLAGASENDFLWLIAADESLAAWVYCDGDFVGLVTGADFVTSSL